jgi:UPF0755 protein
MPEAPQRPPHAPQAPLPRPQPIAKHHAGMKLRRRWFQRKLVIIPASIILVLLIAAVTFAVWYKTSLQPLAASSDKKVLVKVEQAMDSKAIGSLLQKDQVIKSASAFSLYVALHHVGAQLQAGTYSLSPSESVGTIVQHLTGGDVDSLTITFLPGATLAQDKKVLTDAGYSSDEVDKALVIPYQGLLFTDKPAGTDLEGYIYGETYKFSVGTDVQTILLATFNQYEQVIKDNDLINKFAAHGLNLYQGITLASIIQREVSHPTDQQQVAQVFYSRLDEGMALGSDVTYIYAANKMGVTPTPALDSPYNTRINTGLPPGPIAVPGESALLATANPASGDYLFFLSGDDGTTYFSHTAAEHAANIAAHCQQKCSQ